jgi:hypothetical protein
MTGGTVTDGHRRPQDPGVAERSGGHQVPVIRRKLAASLAIVATATGLVVFAHVGAFDSRSDPFPHSVVTPAG